MLRLLRKTLRWLRRSLRALFLAALIAVLLQRSTYPVALAENAIDILLRDVHFDYIGWELNAIGAKIGQLIVPINRMMDDAAQSDYVRDYMTDLARARQLEAQIEALYIDPAQSDPDQTSAALRLERDTLRADLRARQATAEFILERQVTEVLLDAGFGSFGRLFPPVSMRFTQMPNLVVVSPRDRIQRDTELAVDPLPLEEIIALEDRIYTELNQSALVIPLGGMALFPAMIQESANLAWAVETFAHEWVHHYFFFFPLGLNYFVTTAAGSREALTINETVADLFGREIQAEVLRRHYPELLAQTNRTASTGQTAPFDFGAAMHQTRVTVDRFMAIIASLQQHADPKLDQWADQQIDKVEFYMEARRQVFYANGYRIRKMNQAYFAFYGGYQGGIPGIGGDDPIGPAVRAIRAASPDIHQFIVTMRDITTTAELLTVRDALTTAATP